MTFRKVLIFALICLAPFVQSVETEIRAEANDKTTIAASSEVAESSTE